MNEHQKTIISEYALKRIDNSISNEEFEKLNAVLKSDQEAARYYNELMMAVLNFHEFGSKIAAANGSDQYPLDEDILERLALAEQAAPEAVIETANEAATPDVIHTKDIKPGKFMRIYNVIVSAAAVFLIMFLLYANVFPPKYTEQVATVSDQYGVKWRAASERLEIGDGLLTNQAPYALSEGFIKIAYDQGVDVLIEAPAEFQILAKDRIGLKYGKVYSTVADSGIGFSVYTDSAKIIDLGTEFGVFADSNGDTSVHVIKGKTMLIADSDSDTVSMEITRDNAKKVSVANHKISDITCQKEMFAREMNSNHKFIWRGEDSISLADIVGNGNGFGSAKIESGIDIKTGKVVAGLVNGQLDYGITAYKPVEQIQYVDGVFTPGITEGDVITADETVTFPFPKTAGFYWGYIINGAYHVGYDVPKHPLVLNNTIFGTKNNPAITLHANLGITFDLAAIRKNHPKMNLLNFESIIGVSQTVRKYAKKNNPDDIYYNNKYNSKVEFWVLVDGEQMIREIMTDMDDAIRVDVPLPPDSRYLTLAVAEQNETISFAWSLFGNPKINFEVSN